MATLQAPYVYTETRLNLEQRYTGSTVELTLPAHNHSAFTGPAPPVRGVISDIQIGSDEATFTQLHLANEASIYFARHDTNPRNFLWRLLDERRVLEIQAVDLSYENPTKGDAPFTLLLRFPASVRPFGICFAEPEDRDSINVFAITTSDQLYTLNLLRDFFRQLRATDPPPADWCSIYSPPAFNIYSPYRLFAISSSELFVSLAANRLLRLNRKVGEDGSHWQETHFTDSTLTQALKRAMVPSGIFGGRSTIKFGNVDLEPETATAVSLSPDGKFIFAVCLNHTLRTWNVETGRVVAQADLLGNGPLDEQAAAKYFIPPTQRDLLHVVDTLGQAGDSYYVVVYSPKHRRFKFFGMVDEEAGSDGLRDVQSDFEFVPPIDELLDTTIWNLEEFHIIPRKNWRETRLWIRVVSGSASRVYTLAFNLFDKRQELGAIWANGWQSVSAGAQTPDVISLDSPPDADACTEVDISVVDLWDQFLFYPGRFTVPSLETALTIYSRGTIGASRAHATVPLKERIFRAIASSTEMRVSNDRDGIAGDREEIMGDQLRMFYNILKDLHRRRGQVLSFVLDPAEQLPWVIHADSVSPLRTCSELEYVRINKEIDEGHEMAAILEAGSWLSKQVSRGFLLKFEQMVMTEVLDEPSTALSDRLQNLAVASGIAEEVSDDTFDRLVERMGADDSNLVLTTDDFLNPLNAMNQETVGRRNRDFITGYGVRTLTLATQEAIHLNKSTLRDLLLLLLLNVVEYGSDADGEQPLDLEEIFFQLTDKLRQYSVLDFLNSKVRTTQKQKHRSSSVSMVSPGTSDSPSKSSISLTLMESLLISGWSQDMHQPQDAPITELITYWARWWIASTDLATQYDSFTAHILADLIKHGDQLLAQEFLPFVAITGWSTYLKGRFYLSLGKFSEASSCFKKSSFSLGQRSCSQSLRNRLTFYTALGYFDVNQNDTSDLIDLTERDNFSEGLPSYYSHIIALFEKHKAHSYVIDFANLALQALSIQIMQPNSDSEGPTTAPSLGSAGSDPAKLRLDLLNRLFAASIHTSRFTSAYTTLIQISTPDLRKSLLKTFLQALIQQNRIPQLLSFPYTTLAADVDATLWDLARKASPAPALAGPDAPPPSMRYFELAYAWRMRAGDVRGAAQAAFERLARLRAAPAVADDPRDDRLRNAFLVLINALCCLPKEEAWVVVEHGALGALAAPPKALGAGKAAVSARRAVLTLEDVRAEYQAELDRVSRVEAGQWGFGDGEAMETL